MKRKRPPGGMPRAARSKAQQATHLTHRLSDILEVMAASPKHTHDADARKAVEQAVNRRGKLLLALYKQDPSLETENMEKGGIQ